MTQTTQTSFPNPHSVRNTLLARWFPGVRLFPCNAFRIAGMLPVLLVLIIHALAYITAVPGTLVPLLSVYPYSAPVLLFLFHLIFVSTVANYLLLVLIDPGTVPDDWRAPPPSTFSQQHATPSRSRPVLPPVRHSSEPIPLVQKPPATSSPSEFAIDLSSIPGNSNAAVTRDKQSNFRYSHQMHERTYEGYLRYCRTCRAYKPDRSHHCSVCRRCILRMDHHCVFVNNCVSFYNHKFFVSFVTYAFLGCLIVSIISFPTFADIVSIHEPQSVFQPGTGTGAKWANTITLLRAQWYNVTRLIIPHSLHLNLEELSAASNLSSTLRTVTMVGYITSSAFAFALGIFVTLHLYLVAKGRTTIEMYELTDPVRAPLVAQYDLGFRQNVRNVCGTVPLCWLFPTRAFIEGDGLQYERKTPSQQGSNAV